MNVPSSTPPSKGMMMIAAYRAERLSQRPVLRTGLHQSHVARRAARLSGIIVHQAADVAPVETPLPVSIASEPTAPDATSVFAGLVSTAVAEQQFQAALCHGNQVEAAPVASAEAAEPALAEVPAIPSPAMSEAEQPQPAAAPTPESAPEVEPQAAAGTPPVYDPPLAEIGFGPGMLIRLSQLGLYTTSDLAQADPVELRSSLGEISRLVDVDAWIRSARQTASSASSDRERSGSVLEQAGA